MCLRCGVSFPSASRTTWMPPPSGSLKRTPSHRMSCLYHGFIRNDNRCADARRYPISTHQQRMTMRGTNWLLLAIAATVLLINTSTNAAVSVKAYYRLGEAESPAGVAGNSAAAVATDSSGNGND